MYLHEFKCNYMLMPMCKLHKEICVVVL